ncbi:MAG: SGNH/GDSL hydrolase family protein [Saprospiraceae bacterium]
MKCSTVLAACLFFSLSTFGQNASTGSLRVVVIGSSTAAGVGARPIDSAWVPRLEAHLKRVNPANQVINLAKSGYQTWHLLPTGTRNPANRSAPDTLRNISRALSLMPDAIIVNLPSNDAAAGFPVREQIENFESIAFAAWAAGVPVSFTSVQPRNFDQAKIQTQFQVLSSLEKHLFGQIINVWEPLAMPDGRLNPRYDSGDGIHLNNPGHALLFEKIAAPDIWEKMTDRKRVAAVADEHRALFLPLSKNDLRQSPPLAHPTPQLLLQAGQPMSGVSVEVFDLNGRSLLQKQVTLPCLLAGDFGTTGVYSVWLRKGAWSQTVRWVKM